VQIPFSASRKFQRKTLLYTSGLGMMIFIFMAALLVRNMEGFTSTRNFLNTPKMNQTMPVSEDETSQAEFYLLLSILCYNSFSALGVMILPWTLITELYPIQVTKNIFTPNFDWKFSHQTFCRRQEARWVAVR
jgi:hypothetical protein